MNMELHCRHHRRHSWQQLLQHLGDGIVEAERAKQSVRGRRHRERAAGLTGLHDLGAAGWPVARCGEPLHGSHACETWAMARRGLWPRARLDRHPRRFTPLYMYLGSTCSTVQSTVHGLVMVLKRKLEFEGVSGTLVRARARTRSGCRGAEMIKSTINSRGPDFCLTLLRYGPDALARALTPPLRVRLCSDAS